MILQNEKVLFVCETKAQLFNAINIKLNVYKGISADLCLCDNGNNNIGTLQQSVDTSEVFNNSYVYYTRHDTNQTLIAREARRSLVLTRNMKAGEVITATDLMPKRPGTGISPEFVEIVLGRKVVRELEEDTILTWDMI